MKFLTANPFPPASPNLLKTAKNARSSVAWPRSSVTVADIFSKLKTSL